MDYLSVKQSIPRRDADPHAFLAMAGKGADVVDLADWHLEAVIAGGVNLGAVVSLALHVPRHIHLHHVVCSRLVLELR